MSEEDVLKCPKCRCDKFVLIAELIISDVTGTPEDKLANRTIEKETVLSLTCYECRYCLEENWQKWAAY